MKAKLVQKKREQDGKFALLLESEEACQRDMRRQAERLRREAQIRAENKEWGERMGIAPAEIFA